MTIIGKGAEDRVEAFQSTSQRSFIRKLTHKVADPFLHDDWRSIWLKKIGVNIREAWVRLGLRDGLQCISTEGSGTVYPSLSSLL
jgi:hypothetical protein